MPAIVPLTVNQRMNKIKNELAGNKLLKAGMALSLAKASEQATVTYLSAIVEQNFLIIEMLDRLTKEEKEDGNSKVY